VTNPAKLAFFGALLAASAPFASADSISLGSFATGTSAASLGFTSSQTAMNFAGYTAYASPPAAASAPALQSGTAGTYALAANGVWAGPVGNSSWVGSTPDSGPGGINPPYGYYQFTTDFTATAASDYSGSISVMADDTAEVLLNGVAIVPFGALGSDLHCSDSVVNCSTVDVVSLSGITLLGGSDANVLTFIVEQAGSEGTTPDPSGVDFTASLVGDAPVPEPRSLVLLATGLLGGTGCLFRRRKTA